MMAVSRRVLLAAVCSAAILPRVARAQATAGSGGAAAPIVALNAALIAVMKAGDSTPFLQRYQMLAPVVDQVFDLQRIIQVSVGSYWPSLPAAQQQKLEQVFRSFIIANYVANFHNYGGEVSAVSPTTRAVGAQQVVTSTITRSSGDALRIDYVMGQTATGWAVQDILLDGTISRVAVQRSDFESLLAQGNATQLIASLEQKVSSLSAGAISS
jgi:phospholipid transport system substrate-binding protein